MNKKEKLSNEHKKEINDKLKKTVTISSVFGAYEGRVIYFNNYTNKHKIKFSSDREFQLAKDYVDKRLHWRAIRKKFYALIIFLTSLIAAVASIITVLR